jgi:hypothetical protein
MRRARPWALGVVCLVVAACGSNGTQFGDGGPPDGAPVDGGGDVSLACGVGQASCGGTCVDVKGDPKNCGGCGVTCSAQAACCDGHCVEGSTGCAFAVTYSDPNLLWQSGGDYLHVQGQGFASGMKVMIGDGRAAVLVVDAQHAVLQTPPGPVGYADVTISLGAETSTTKALVQYVSAGLTTPWQQIQMSSVRGEFPGVAPMQDGRVLVVNGVTTPDQPSTALTSADVFSRSNNTNAPAANGTIIPRWRNAAVTMLDGRVLVVGNACDGAACSNGGAIDVFDPATNTFSQSAATLSVGGFWTHGILLVDGRVLVTSYKTTAVDVYDPATDKVTSFASTPVTGGYPVRLRDGTVLLMGDDDYSGDGKCAVFDSDNDTFTAVGSFKTASREQFTAHTLPSGKVIVLGGGPWPSAYDTIEIYDPTAKTFSLASYHLLAPRTWHASALVRDGTILVIGGYFGSSCTATNLVDQVDPVAGTVTAFATLPNANTELNAVTLIDGSVLAVGGGACGTTTALPYLDFLPGVDVPRPPPPN